MLFCLFHPCSMVEPADLRLTRIPLNHGAGHMSALGFGTLIPDAAVTITATRDAPEAGFRHFDCAERYGNEREVGWALQAEFAGGENRLPGGQGSSLAVIVTLSVLRRAASRRQAYSSRGSVTSRPRSMHRGVQACSGPSRDGFRSSPRADRARDLRPTGGPKTSSRCRCDGLRGLASARACAESSGCCWGLCTPGCRGLSELFAQGRRGRATGRRPKHETPESCGGRRWKLLRSACTPPQSWDKTRRVPDAAGVPLGSSGRARA